MVKKMSRVKVMYILLAVLVMFCSVCPRFVVLAADSQAIVKSLSNIHLHDVADSSKTGYQTENLDAMPANKYEDSDCPTSLKNWFNMMISNNADFKKKFDGVLTAEQFVDNYSLYLVARAGEGNEYCSLRAFVFRKDIRVCLIDSGYGFRLYFPYSAYGQRANYNIGFTVQNFRWANLEFGGESGKQLSYDSSLVIQNRYVGHENVKGVDTAYTDYGYNSTSGTKKSVVYTNFPVVNDLAGVAKFINDEDDSAANNKITPGGNKGGEGCDSFGWDSFDCSLTKDATNGYMFLANYKYDSYPKMVASPEDYQIVVQFTLDAKWLQKNDVYITQSYSTEKLNYTLSPNYLKSLRINGSHIVFKPDVGTVNKALDVLDNGKQLIAALKGCSVDDITKIQSCYIYANIMLFKLGGNAGYSSDVRQFRWDYETLAKTELTPSVKTEGEGADKKVTQVVGNDDGKTVINITVNVTGGSGGDGGSGGSGGSGGDGGSGGSGGGGGSGTVTDPSASGFWSILKGIVAFFKALLDGEDGLFPVIAAFFEFIPASFWTVVIGAVVIIAVVSIYKLLKK